VVDEKPITVNVAEQPLEPTKYEKSIALKITGISADT